MDRKYDTPPDWKTGKTANAGKKPGRTLEVSPELGRSFQFFEVKRVVKAWSLELDCDVEPRFQNGRLVRFEIYGPSANLDATYRVVKKWIDRSVTKTAASASWAKLPAWENQKWTEDKLRQEVKERKQVFRGPVPEGLSDKVEVAWPQELLHAAGITPRDVFGNKLESLDSIRTDCEVFITLLTDRDNPPPWQVEICGFNMDDVQAGAECYRNVIQKVMKQKFLGHEKVNMILDEIEGINVLIQKADEWWPRKNFKIVPRLLPAPMSDEPGTFRSEGLHFTRLAIIQHHIERSIEAIRFERGSYDFAIRYGCLALSNFPVDQIGNQYSVTRFMNGIHTVVGCHVLKWIANCELGQLLFTRIMKADHILEPAKTSLGSSGFTPPTLKDTRPVLRGTWVLHDPNSPVAQKKKVPDRNPGRPTPNDTRSPAVAPNAPPCHMIVVQIDWTEDEDGMYEKMPPVFYRLKPGNAAPIERMDINLLELGVSKGWHFGLESMALAPKSTLSPIIIGFAERVKLKPGFAKNYSSQEIFAQWSLGPTQRIEMARLDRIYTFGIKKTGYQVEAVAMWYPFQTVPCWGLSVRHREWAAHLCELERLPQGQGVEFGDIVERFLPANGVTSAYDPDEDADLPQLQKLELDGDDVPQAKDGVRILVNKLLELSAVINN